MGCPTGMKHELRRGDLRVWIETDTDRLASAFGPRFDRTAQVVSVRRGGLSYLDEHGLVDEIGLRGNGVLGYERAKGGGRFAKVGVGTLRRDSAGEYDFTRKYPVLSLAEVELEELSVSCLCVRQELKLDERFGYRWEKRYELESNDGLAIYYRLSNLGTEPCTFEQYNHNFLRIGEDPIDESYRVELGFPFPRSPEGNGYWSAEGQELRLVKSAPQRGGARWGGELEGASAEGNRLSVSSSRGGKMQIEGDFCPARFFLWALRSTICPEVFWRNEVKPGQTRKTERRYRFE